VSGAIFIAGRFNNVYRRSVIGVGIDVVRKNRGRPASRLREILILISNNPGIKFRKLAKKAKEYFDMDAKRIYDYLNAEFRLKIKLFSKEFHVSVFPIIPYRLIPFDERRVYFVGRPPTFISILYILNAAGLLINAIRCYIQGEFAFTVIITISLLIGIPCLFLRWWIGRIILKHYEICVGKVLCIIRHGKNTRLLKKFSLNTRMYEIKEYALKELERRRGKPIRREYLLYLIDKSGARVLPEPNSTLYPYALNSKRLLFELILCKRRIQT